MKRQPLRIPPKRYSKLFMSTILLILMMLVPHLVAEEDGPIPLELPRPKTAISGSGTVDPVSWMAIDPEADTFQTLVRNHPERRLEYQLATLDLIWPLEYQKRKPRPAKIVLELEKTLQSAMKPKGLAEMMREEKTRDEQETERKALFAIMFPVTARADQHWIP